MASSNNNRSLETSNYSLGFLEPTKQVRIDSQTPRNSPQTDQLVQENKIIDPFEENIDEKYPLNSNGY